MQIYRSETRISFQCPPNVRSLVFHLHFFYADGHRTVEMRGGRFHLMHERISFIHSRYYVSMKEFHPPACDVEAEDGKQRRTLKNLQKETFFVSHNYPNIF